MSAPSVNKFTIKIDIKSDVPIYRQIAYELESMILETKRPLGYRMPSVRKLAEITGADPNTVQQSYKLLKSEGVIRSEPGKGCYVATGSEELRKIKKKRVAEKLKSVAREARSAGFWTEDLFLIIMEEYDK